MNVQKNAYCPKNKTSVTKNIIGVLSLEIQEIGWDLSLMKISYNLTKRTTKNEKFEKNFNMFIINFKTIRYKLTASGNIIHSMLN